MSGTGGDGSDRRTGAAAEGTEAPMRCERERRAVVDAARTLVAEGLVVGTAGNVSLRAGDGEDALVAVTPSGLDYAAMTPDLIGLHRPDGTAVDAPLAPTSEMGMHLEVYARTAARAVVHTHSPSAAALSVLVEEVPPIHYYLALFGGRVPVVGYAPYGSAELAEAAAGALEGAGGCLLGNHGAVTVGADLGQALERARHLEWLCEVSLRVLGAGRPYRALSAEEMAEVGARIGGYGQRPPER
ncbi:class II aldolase/adducin family protein [Nocardiopsis composta]|uniref:L-fuculose-phosphate aldolase n=1 Tax=Nocardiopsis composta TaxID=157465 RepID=A0A7W8QS98_9ACTN|nr:class II aldolase/adducin family protein [Nocardiopsis composta]MBB5435541.1 L-fuculose-phosphate aldolase [Nocardiopsis composta]